MKKIFTSLAVAFLSISFFAVAAYAIHSVISPATVGGVTFACGNASLQIYNEDMHDWRASWSPSFKFNNLVPGGIQEKTFALRNNSSPDVTFLISGILHNPRHHDSDWEILKNAIRVEIWKSENEKTGYQTLDEWSKNNTLLPGGSLKTGEKRVFHFHVAVDPQAGNEISKRTLDKIDFYFTGKSLLQVR